MESTGGSKARDDFLSSVPTRSRRWGLLIASTVHEALLGSPGSRRVGSEEYVCFVDGLFEERQKVVEWGETSRY